MTAQGWYPDPSGSGGQRYWDGTAWGPVAPAAAPTHPGAAVNSRTKIILLSIGGLLIILVTISSLSGGGKTKHINADGSTTSSTTARSTTSEAEIQRQQEARAKREAQAAAKLDPANYKTLSPRDFALLVKNPDAHIGELVVVYGKVTQFDSATGTADFRAGTAAEPSRYYEQNTVISAQDQPSIVAGIVEDDLLKMYAEVLGSFSYDTSIGGKATVPHLSLHVVEVVGHDG